MSESKQIDTFMTEYIVCPHCGHEHEDHGDWFPNGQDVSVDTCVECNGTFRTHCDYTVNYITEPLTTTPKEPQ